MKMFAMMCGFVLISSFAFAQEPVSGVENHGDSVVVSFGAKKVVVTSKSEVIEPMTPEVSSAALETFDAEASKTEVSTITVSAKSKAFDLLMKAKKVVDFEMGMRLRSFNGLNTLSQPIGFATTSSDQTGVKAELSLQLEVYRKFALEVLPLPNSRTLDTQFYGSSLGSIKVVTDSVWIGKFFPIDTSTYSVSIGFGYEHTKLDGAISMGGFNFPTTGAGWSPVFQIGGQYHLNKCLSLGVDYERSNVRIVTKIPGVPDLVSTYSDRLSMRVMMKFMWTKLFRR
jgi:hypothetical protein